MEIGDIITKEEATKWCHIGPNIKIDSTWKIYPNNITSDRTIINIEKSASVPCFQLSNCRDDVYFRLEGFEEFINNERGIIPELEIINYSIF